MALFDTSTKCDYLTNNFSESFNNMIIGLRDLPLVKLVQKYQLMVMSLLYKRKCKAVETMAGSIVVPRVEKLIQKYKRQYKDYTNQGSTDWMHVAIDKVGVTWTVDLKEHTCSYCEWQVSGVPCVHAMAVLLPRRETWEMYCSPYMTVETYKATYDGFVHPIDDIQFRKEPLQKVLPPPLYRPPGRPRNNRIRNKDEVAPEKNKRKRCSKCGMLGHNKKTCKGAVATDANGRRVRPRTGPTEGANGPTRPSLPIPPAPATRNNAARGNRGRGRARGRVFYPPTSRFTPSSTAPLQSGTATHHGWDISHSERSLNQ